MAMFVLPPTARNWLSHRPFRSGFIVGRNGSTNFRFGQLESTIRSAPCLALHRRMPNEQ
jgi:hypothetical protein